MEASVRIQEAVSERPSRLDNRGFQCICFPLSWKRSPCTLLMAGKFVLGGLLVAKTGCGAVEIRNSRD